MSFAPRSSSGRRSTSRNSSATGKAFASPTRHLLFQSTADTAAGTRRSRTPTASSRSARHRHTTWRPPPARCARYVRFARGDAEGAFEDLGARACSRPRNGISGETHPGPSRSRPCARVARATRRSTRATSSRGWHVARANPALAGMLGSDRERIRKLGVTSDVDEIISQAPDGPWKDVALAELRW